MDMTHMNALLLGLSNERARLEEETTEQGRKLRTVWVKQIEKEIEGEREFLGLDKEKEFEGSDEELLSELLKTI